MHAQCFHYDIACKVDALALCVRWKYARTMLPFDIACRVSAFALYVRWKYAHPTLPLRHWVQSGRFCTAYLLLTDGILSAARR